MVPAKIDNSIHRSAAHRLNTRSDKSDRFTRPTIDAERDGQRCVEPKSI